MVRGVAGMIDASPRAARMVHESPTCLPRLVGVGLAAPAAAHVRTSRPPPMFTP